MEQCPPINAIGSLKEIKDAVISGILTDWSMVFIKDMNTFGYVFNDCVYVANSNIVKCKRK